MNELNSTRRSRRVRLASSQEVICPYCNNQADLVSGRSIYPHRPDLFNRFFYECEPCGAYVGCHRAGKKYGVETVPLGRLANAELRQAKREAHDAFDPLWLGDPKKRNEAYAWLAKTLGIPQDECHIGMFDVAQCGQVIEVCQNRVKNITIKS